MKILMFGWEFPPMKSGGLGTACHDLCKGLYRQNIDVTFVVPSMPDTVKNDFVRLVSASKYCNLKKVNSLLSPYMTYGDYSGKTIKGLYGINLFSEVKRYASAALEIVKDCHFDVIHCHDWMTYEAGIKAKELSNKPLVVHIHATEEDRTGGNSNPEIFSIEKDGLRKADLIIANSNFTKNNVIRLYGIDGQKIRVVHWGIDALSSLPERINPFNKPTVLFLGRVTLQKGPEYFVEAAKKVNQINQDVQFVFAGDGDMFERTINQVHNLGLMDNFHFTGFLKGRDVDKAFRMADLYVMPSVAEPFGLVALEALRNGTPILISKQSGVSEVVQNALRVDFWDTDAIAGKILAFVDYHPLKECLREYSAIEAGKFNIDVPAKKCVDCYKEVLKW